MATKYAKRVLVRDTSTGRMIVQFVDAATGAPILPQELANYTVVGGSGVTSDDTNDSSVEDTNTTSTDIVDEVGNDVQNAMDAGFDDYIKMVSDIGGLSMEDAFDTSPATNPSAPTPESTPSTPSAPSTPAEPETGIGGPETGVYGQDATYEPGFQAPTPSPADRGITSVSPSDDEQDTVAQSITQGMVDVPTPTPADRSRQEAYGRGIEDQGPYGQAVAGLRSEATVPGVTGPRSERAMTAIDQAVGRAHGVETPGLSTPAIDPSFANIGYLDPDVVDVPTAAPVGAVDRGVSLAPPGEQASVGYGEAYDVDMTGRGVVGQAFDAPSFPGYNPDMSLEGQLSAAGLGLGIGDPYGTGLADLSATNVDRGFDASRFGTPGPDYSSPTGFSTGGYFSADAAGYGQPAGLSQGGTYGGFAADVGGMTGIGDAYGAAHGMDTGGASYGGYGGYGPSGPTSGGALGGGYYGGTGPSAGTSGGYGNTGSASTSGTSGYSGGYGGFSGGASAQDVAAAVDGWL